MIERTLEKNIMDAISAVVSGVSVMGFNQIAPEGQTKIFDAPFVAVRCAPKQNTVESTPAYEIMCEVAVVTNRAEDARMVNVNTWGEAVSELIDSWNGNANSAERAALKAALDGTGYSVQGMQDNGGENGSDSDGMTFYFSKTINLHVIMA